MKESEKSESGRLLQSLRKNRRGGRPRSGKPLCPCGAMTVTRAKRRWHKCNMKEEEVPK